MSMNQQEEQQICFPIGDFMLCNFVIRKDGTVIRGINGFLKFPLRSKLVKRKEPDESDSLPSNLLLAK